MTDQKVFAALSGVLQLERELLTTGRAAEAAGLIEEKMRALQDFETRWREDALVMDKWFAIQACVPGATTV